MLHASSIPGMGSNEEGSHSQSTNKVSSQSETGTRRTNLQGGYRLSVPSTTERAASARFYFPRSHSFVTSAPILETLSSFGPHQGRG